MALTFTIESSDDAYSSVKILDSNFYESFASEASQLPAKTSTLGFDSRWGFSFGPWQALRALIQVRGEFRTSSFKVFDCFCLRALTRAFSGTAHFRWWHQHTLIGAAPTLLAGAWTGRGQPTSRSLLDHAALCHWILLYLTVMLNSMGAEAGHWAGLLKQDAWLKPGFGSTRPLLPIIISLLHHNYLLWQ